MKLALVGCKRFEFALVAANDHIDLVVRQEKSAIFLGSESRAGKSTLMNVLLRSLPGRGGRDPSPER
jgi:ABC-type uncharacterized transport system ATPase subunit